MPLEAGAARNLRSRKLRRVAEYCDFLDLISGMHQRNMDYELGYRCLMASHADDMRAFRSKLLRNFRRLMHRLRVLETKGVLPEEVTEEHMASYAFYVLLAGFKADVPDVNIHFNLTRTNLRLAQTAKYLEAPDEHDTEPDESSE